MVRTESEAETRAEAAKLAKGVVAGEVVLLSGVLGAGKTTFVRGFLEAIGHVGVVRSPTFNLIQTFETLSPKVVHADLYRIESVRGLGLEEYLADYILLIEWPDRLGDWIAPDECWQVSIEFDGEGRLITVRAPQTNPTR